MEDGERSGRLAASAAYAEGMASGSAYAEHALSQKQCIDALCQAYLADALDSVRVAGGGVTTFADFGCADCINSLDMYCDARHWAAGAGCCLTVFAVDQPSNDWEVVHKTCEGAGFAVRAGNDTVDVCDEPARIPTVATVAGSFYNSLLEANSLDVGVSIAAMHWLSSDAIAKYDLSVPAGVLHDGALPPSDSVRAHFAQAALEDGVAFFKARSAELRAGGRLLLSNTCPDPALDADGLDQCTYKALWKEIAELFSAMGASHVWVPLHQRTLEEWHAILDHPEVAPHFELLREQRFSPPNPYYVRHFGAGSAAGTSSMAEKAAGFAADYTASFAAWGKGLLRRGFGDSVDRHGEFLSRLRERVASGDLGRFQHDYHYVLMDLKRK